MSLRKLYYLLSALTLLDIAVLTVMCDPIRENYSMLTREAAGFIFVLILCILLSILMYILSSNKLSFLIVLAGTVPFSFLHEIFAYVSFFALTVIFLETVIFTKYRYVFVLLLGITVFIYLQNYAAVNALSETVYLTGIVITGMKMMQER